MSSHTALELPNEKHAWPWMHSWLSSGRRGLCPPWSHPSARTLSASLSRSRNNPERENLADRALSARAPHRRLTMLMSPIRQKDFRWRKRVSRRNWKPKPNYGIRIERGSKECLQTMDAHGIGYRFVLRNRPFRTAKRPVSPFNTGRFASRNGTFRKSSEVQLLTMSPEPQWQSRAHCEISLQKSPVSKHGRHANSMVSPSLSTGTLFHTA